MILKKYQQRVLRETRLFLDHLAAEQATRNKWAAQEAWDKSRAPLLLRGDYHRRQNAIDGELPNFCLKIPTGGGKTLLATQILGQVYQTILKGRNGTGLALWIVPSDQIYKDTLKALRDRRHPYRQSLESAAARRVEIWEKHEIYRMTPGRLRSALNVLIFKLAGANREVRDQVKFFRDSGGNIVQHFPPENDLAAHKELKERIPNLDTLPEDPKDGEFLVQTSIGNLVRLEQPPVILDEGHKATSVLARDTIREFNACMVVELSATPPEDANILVRVSGEELLAEEMIKLPINVSNSNQSSWKDCLVRARDRREELSALAKKHFKKSDRLIRPIVLVQVERTGNDQRVAPFIHSLDVKEHLIQKLGIQEAAIAIKTSSRDDIEDQDLLDDGCRIEWIITKSALQEGWDCPFAYLLVCLTNSGSQRSMTQLVGRVLRQPFTERTPFEELNQCYVYCLKKRAADIVKEVKKALQKEGYEGDASAVVDRSGAEGAGPARVEARMRNEFSVLYRPFQGKVYLPKFCVRSEGAIEPLDYYRHLISRVDVGAFDYAGGAWDLRPAMNESSETLLRITLGSDAESHESGALAFLESDVAVKAWMIANVTPVYMSVKRIREVVEGVVREVVRVVPELRDRLATVKFALREKVEGFLHREIDVQTEKAFKGLFDEGRLCFYLECVEGRFELPPSVQIRPTRLLHHEDLQPVQRSLFDPVPDDLNEYERAVALFLDRRPQVLWWYRNLVGADKFAIQGFRRNKIYPDFVIQQGRERKPIETVLVLETKGKHLEANPDTRYKKDVAEYFERVGKRVPWQKLGKDFQDNTFRFQVLDEGEYGDRNWRVDLERVLKGEAVGLADAE